jgi:hypothetical protein
MTIRKLPNKNVWILKSKKNNKILGRYRTKKAALKREKQIEYFNHFR